MGNVTRKRRREEIEPSATEDRQCPFLVAIKSEGEVICGGTIIHPEYVLTAAHCFDGGMSNLTVEVGSDTIGRGTDIEVREVIIHQNYIKEEAWDSDIALLKVPPMEMQNGVRQAKLPDNDEENGELYVTGWGIRLDEPAQKKLRDVRDYQVEIKQFALCKEEYQEYARKNLFYVNDSHVCVESMQSVDVALGGNSGGPLTDGDVIYAVMSAGKPNKSVICTRVRSFIEWIRAKIDDKNMKNNL